MRNLIKCVLLIHLFALNSYSSFSQNSLKTTQLKNKRVKDAYNEKWPSLKKKLIENGIDSGNYHVLIRLFKEEQKLEVWVRNANDIIYNHLLDYDICASSGDPGPKRKEGDGQVPEGFYQIDLFNPNSAYYLSMRINYPNKSDAILGKRPLGGAIMIHGNCVTIGCVPITDDKIKELYVLCLESKNMGKEIVVHSFPFKMSKEKMQEQKEKSEITLYSFWENLKVIYDYFDLKKTIPKIKTDKSGKYYITN